MEITSLERRRYFHLPHSQTSDYILISHYLLQQEMESSLWKSPLFTSSPCLGVWEISMEMSPPARDGVVSVEIPSLHQQSLSGGVGDIDGDVPSSKRWSRLCGNPLSSPVVPVWGCGRYRWRCPLQQEMESSLWKSPLFTSSPCLGVWEISMEMSPPVRDGVCGNPLSSPVVPVWGCGRYRWRCPLHQEMESSLWKSPLFTSSPCLGVWEISMEMSPPARDGVVSVEIPSLHQ